MAIGKKSVSGRGTMLQPKNSFLKQEYGAFELEGIDAILNEEGDIELDVPQTKFIEVNARTIVNKVSSPDVPFDRSINPYQGCEHGCAYCYARPTHEYWGYSAGTDFERFVMMKRNAPELLETTLRSPKWDAAPITISGNTDPYQPIERKERIMRGLLKVAHSFNQPIGIITKNSLVLRDIDLLADMAKRNLVGVAISVTSLDEPLRRVLEPRTSTAKMRLRAIQELSSAGVPVMVLLAPIIPGINEHEIPDLMQAAAEAGARNASYTIVRTNGPVEEVFRDWLLKNFPDRAAKVIAQISDIHGGGMNDSTFGRRLRGEGSYAANIRNIFNLMRRKYFSDQKMPELDRTLFKPPPFGQLDLFH